MTEDMNNIDVTEFSVGQRVQGTVSKVEEKQVVIEVKDSKHDGIVPISELSSLHVEKASDVVNEGDELEFEIIKVEDEALILSKRKVDAEKAWGDLVDSFENGEIIETEVKDVVKGGLVVDLGVRGFVPASLVEDYFVEDFSDYKGKTLAFKIVELDQEKNRLILSHRDVVREEKEKKKFAGFELSGKKLGVIGLGAIGRLVANTAIHLGMEVYGYDPYISVDGAWNLSKNVQHSKDVKEIHANCDYITIHVPLLDSTKGMINDESISKMKDGVILLNFARDLLADEEAVLRGIKNGKIRKYVTDFPNKTVAGKDGCIVIPHLGASTEESEDNCAVMAVKELINYLDNGNIINSVNYPNCDMGVCAQVGRIAIFHENKKNMISRFSSILGDAGINITDMTNKSKGEVAYSLMDLEAAVTPEIIEELKAVEGVVRVRVVK